MLLRAQKPTLRLKKARFGMPLLQIVLMLSRLTRQISRKLQLNDWMNETVAVKWILCSCCLKDCGSQQMKLVEWDFYFEILQVRGGEDEGNWW